MLDLTLDIAWPAGVTSGADTRESFFETVGGRINSAMEDMVDAMRTRTPYPTIAGGFGLRREGGLQSPAWVITNDVQHWIYREVDTRPHEILPHWGPWLWFFSEQLGHVIHVRRVDHPGTTGNHILTETWNELIPGVMAAADEGVAEWFSRWAA